MNALEAIVRAARKRLNLSCDSRFVSAIRPAYDAVLQAMFGARGLRRNINGEQTIRIRPSYRAFEDTYEPAVYDFLKSAVRPGSTVLEIGAHVGVFTIILARWAGPEGRVIAFEPTPETRSALQDHLELNSVADRVSVNPHAISDSTGTASFYALTNNQENTLSPSHSRILGAALIQVPMTTIDAFCKQHDLRPSLLKIDIEGFELHALRGARETLSRYRPKVVVELHPMNWPEIGVKREDFEDVLRELKYRPIPLNGQNDPLKDYGHVVLEPAA